jgi:signal transduction histidine kinase
VKRQVSARARLTALYTTLFAACGGVLIAVTYLLLAQNLSVTTTTTTPESVQVLIDQCVVQEIGAGIPEAAANNKCASLYAEAIRAGADQQRTATLNNLLLYSLLTLGGVTLLSAVAGWVVAGRILRPVKALIAATRAASGQDLSHRLALTGPRDELRELADTFDEMLDRLDRAFTAQRQFIANAGHELRTPLTVMRTAIDVVLAKPNPTRDELVGMGEDVRSAVDGAERLIGALLTLARNSGSAGGRQPLDLATIAEDALEERPITGLTTRSSLYEARVSGDGVLLERLIANLLDNAEKYNIPGGTISLSTSSDGGTCSVRVVNSGPVIPPEQVDRLFLPFTRLDDRTEPGGFGLGLALVSSIATSHGGTAGAVALPAGGLDVTVRLPRHVSGFDGG